MTLIAIGGAENRTGDMPVLQRVVIESGKRAPSVLVITTATSYPEETGDTFRNAFTQLGAAVETRHAVTKTEADALLEDLKRADIVFFTGGDQMKIADAFTGTEFLTQLKAREATGLVVAGTSAGAAAMSQLMISGGDPAKPAQDGGLYLTEGLGLKTPVVFDTHFMNRGRLPRLFNAVAADAAKTGVGLDEDTGVVIKGNAMEVIGSGAVTVVMAQGARSYKAGDTFKI